MNLAQNFISGADLTRLPVGERPAFFNDPVANPLACLLPGSAINGATVPRSALLNSYPHFSQVTLTNVPVGSQSYHSLQTRASRRSANGLASTLSYTWSKTLERVSVSNAQGINVTNLLGSGLEQRLLNFDIPHTFSGLVAYELPFGKGRKFMSGAHRVTQAVFGNWGLNVQYMTRSGVPFDFPNAGPLAARSAKLSDSQRDSLAVTAGRPSFNPFFDKYFDTTLFPRWAQAPFTLRDFPTRFPDVRSRHLESWEKSSNSPSG